MNAKRIVVVFVVIAIVIGGVATSLHFIFRPPPVRHATLELDTPYFIQSKRPGTFRFPDARGMPTGALVRLQNQDQSFAIFENDWQTFRIRIVRGNDYTDMWFIVASIRTGRRGWRAQVTHVYGGMLRTYTISVTQTHVVMTATAISRVTVASAEWVPSPVIEVFRTQSTIMEFHVTPPRWAVLEA